jgi:hypothetical protein
MRKPPTDAKARITVECHAAFCGEESMDEVLGLTLTHLSGWPARIAGHDLALRRKAEALIFELRTAIADHCQRRADELERDERK